MTTRKIKPAQETRPTVPFPKCEGQFHGWGPRLA